MWHVKVNTLKIRWLTRTLLNTFAIAFAAMPPKNILILMVIEEHHSTCSRGPYENQLWVLYFNLFKRSRGHHHPIGQMQKGTTKTQVQLSAMAYQCTKRLIQM